LFQTRGRRALPRLLEKARAAATGKLDDFIFSQSPNSAFRGAGHAPDLEMVGD